MSANKEKFTKPYDTAIFAYTVLKRLGCGKVDTFEQRLKSQKVQYFAQLFNVSPTYSFGLYLRGPYSSDLSHDLFAIRDGNIAVDVSRFVPDELEERLVGLKKFINGKSTRELEVASALHWLTNVAKMNKSRAREKLKEWKCVNSSEFNKTVNLLKQL